MCVLLKMNIDKKNQPILSNLNELHVTFKAKYPHAKTGFSRFCELKPKMGVLACSTDTESKWLSTYRQEIKLSLAPINITYELFAFTECNKSNKECMIQRYSCFPEYNHPLKKIISISGDLEDLKDEQIIKFSQ